METLCTIGFTKKALQPFIELLTGAGVTKLIDIRLRNNSQLAGFAKRDDLAFILNLCGIDYEHAPELAPTDELLDEYRRSKDWLTFERAFRTLLRERDPLSRLEQAANGNATVCLLCSEHEPDKCHRRLVAEYVAERTPTVEVIHLS